MMDSIGVELYEEAIQCITESPAFIEMNLP
jgi:hypothetical protein